MNWNAFPKSYNLEEIGIRRQNLAHKPLISGPDQLSMPQIRRSKVIINPVKESNYRCQYQKNIPKVSGRAAKMTPTPKFLELICLGMIDAVDLWNSRRKIPIMGLNLLP